MRSLSVEALRGNISNLIIDGNVLNNANSLKNFFPDKMKVEY